MFCKSCTESCNSNSFETDFHVINSLTLFHTRAFQAQQRQQAASQQQQSLSGSSGPLQQDGGAGARVVQPRQRLSGSSSRAGMACDSSSGNRSRSSGSRLCARHTALGLVTQPGGPSLSFQLVSGTTRAYFPGLQGCMTGCWAAAALCCWMLIISCFCWRGCRDDAG